MFLILHLITDIEFCKFKWIFFCDSMRAEVAELLSYDSSNLERLYGDKTGPFMQEQILI